MGKSIVFPPGFDPTPILGPLNSRSVDPKWGHPAARRHVTRTDPVRFALMYLPHLLRSPETGDRLTLNRLHLDMAERAKAWIVPGRHRDGWVAPRGAGKSRWAFLILVLWALAHGHRRFFVAFANNSAQAEMHLANIRKELAENALLLNDFPHLRPGRGQGASDTARDVTCPAVTVDGVRFGPVSMAARGIDSQAAGMSRDIRPDLLVGDDLEPDESSYSPDAKVKRLATLVNTVFAMNTEAAVSLTGYVTMPGSITHDLVRHALGERTEGWVVEQGFAGSTHYYPAIVTRDGRRESLWAARWSLRYLESIEGSRFYALNFANNPAEDTEGSSWWSDSLFVYTPDAQIREPIMWVDPAVSEKQTSDYTAVAIMGLTSRGKVVIAYCRGFKVGPAERKRKIHELCRQWGVRRVFVEVNQGGDLWTELLSPMPRGIELIERHASGAKHVRIGDLLHHYECGDVEHLSRLRDLQDQQRSYPSNATHDDLIDAASGGVLELLGRKR